MSEGLFFIAEAGVNHDGDFQRALGLVEAAAAAGADAVKFQTFRAEAIASRHAAKAAYQQRETGADESQLAMLRRLELPYAWHAPLKAAAEARGLVFLSTPFDLESLDFLVRELGATQVKLGSGEVTNAPLLRAAGASGLPVILSTGMSDLAEVEAALGVLAHGILGRDDPGATGFGRAFAEGRAALAERVTLLHCVSEYPAPAAEANLRAIDSLAAAFGLPVGFSDHTRGTAVALAAAGRGARVVEKHFTLDRTLPGPDHAASLEPGELARLVTELRLVARALGDGVKRPMPCEAGNRAVARKSLVAARPIRAGEPYSAENLATKRPGTGRSPFDYWSLLGTPAPRDLAEDEPVP